MFTCLGTAPVTTAVQFRGLTVSPVNDKKDGGDIEGYVPKNGSTRRPRVQLSSSTRSSRKRQRMLQTLAVTINH